MTSFRDLVARGRRSEQAGDLTGAIAQYSKVIALQQGTVGGVDPGIYNRVGDLYQQTGEPSRAVAAYEQALDLYERQELYPNAIALCKKILRNAPDRLHFRQRAGRLLARSGLRAEARQQYVAYATALESKGRVEEAVAAFEELHELIDDDETRDQLIEACVRSGLLDRAVDELLGMWRDRVGDAAEASAIRDRIIKIDPGADPLGVETARHVKSKDQKSRRKRDVPLASGHGADDQESDEDALVEELRAALHRLDRDEKLRQALPILDQLLDLQPDRVDLLLRKLRYALSLREEEMAIEAYLALGQALERELDAFSIRYLSSSSSEGVTAAVDVRAMRSERAAE